MCAAARLVRVVGEPQAARAELAELAIGWEMAAGLARRARPTRPEPVPVFLKADPAVPLLHTDQQAARDQIEGLRGVARGALRDVRAVTRDQEMMSGHSPPAAQLSSRRGAQMGQFWRQPICAPCPVNGGLDG